MHTLKPQPSQQPLDEFSKSWRERENRRGKTREKATERKKERDKQGEKE